MPYDVFSIRLPEEVRIPTLEDLKAVLVTHSEDCIVIYYRLMNGKGGAITLLTADCHMFIEDGLNNLVLTRTDALKGQIPLLSAQPVVLLQIRSDCLYR